MTRSIFAAAVLMMFGAVAIFAVASSAPRKRSVDIEITLSNGSLGRLGTVGTSDVHESVIFQPEPRRAPRRENEEPVEGG